MHFDRRSRSPAAAAACDKWRLAGRRLLMPLDVQVVALVKVVAQEALVAAVSGDRLGVFVVGGGGGAG